MNSDDVRREFEQDWESFRQRVVKLCEKYFPTTCQMLADSHKPAFQAGHQAAAARYGAEIEKLLTRIAELEGQIHSCPTCGENCKQCRCVETRIAELE